ncbi:MAG: hypothetical protein XD95_0130 [Microgenomates bacterium 39_7]|nr:MAG: hypothetical protein XD95_0130 [Microgenomates bacterium 39_7]
MLNTQKILYILPDLAYLAELLPGKKPHSFVIQSFKQYNGELMESGKFIYENLLRLFKKLEAEEYDIVLSDDLFANTIIDVERKTEKEVRDYLKEEVIPSLHIDAESHQIETFILSEYKGVHKVQLSTIQKKLLSPLKKALESTDAKLKRIFPLSWAIKSLISLEPSISIVQLGKHLFMAKHYIGVDQPLVDTSENLDRFVEAIKTLKGTEPSLQTVYLITDQAIEEELKEKLEGVLPLQQLAEQGSDEEQVPGFLEKIITSSMMTVSIPDFEIPQFDLKGVEVSEVGAVSDIVAPIMEDDDLAESNNEEEIESNTLNSDLPKPGSVDATEEVANIIDESAPAIISSENDLESEPTDSTESNKVEPEVKEDLQPIIEQEQVQETKKEDSQTEPESTTVEAKPTLISPKNSDDKSEINQAVVIGNEGISEDVDLKKFASVKVESEQEDQPVMIGSTDKNKAGKKVLKNNDGTSSFIKIFLIGLGSFVLTVAIGVGVGYGLLQLSQPSTKPIEEPQVEIVEPTPELEEPEPEVTISEIDRSEYSIRVVNATTRAGYAGKIASTLEEAGYQTVDAKNAVEDYEPGVYVLMTEEFADLIVALNEDLEMNLVFLEGVEAEDPRGEFDAVVVLAE